VRLFADRTSRQNRDHVTTSHTADILAAKSECFHFSARLISILFGGMELHTFQGTHRSGRAKLKPLAFLLHSKTAPDQKRRFF